MDPAILKAEIKRLIVSELKLDGRDPSTIDDDAPLFGEGLGLDSLDALQLAISLEEKFGVRIPEGDEARPIFRSVSAIAEYVAAARPAAALAGG
jgi:acyl carrier protein